MFQLQLRRSSNSKLSTALRRKTLRGGFRDGKEDEAENSMEEENILKKYRKLILNGTEILESNKIKLGFFILKWMS